jgi:Ser/Thr protein kinase RdoA (MazF antagonist)
LLNHAVLLDEIPAVLKVWGCTGVLPVSPVLSGTLNWNFEVPTTEGRRFLRCYRQNLETERILGEHALLAWVARRGIPVPVPIAAPDGNTLAIVGDHRWALFPWARGAAVERGHLLDAQTRELGDVHGRIQAALAEHPLSNDAKMTLRWDKTQSLDHLTRLIAKGRETGAEDWLINGMERQRRLLDVFDVLAPDDFSSLPCQLLHGDFHAQQVMFEDARVTAVVDWEIWHVDPRAWELVRSLAFSQMLDSPQLEDYLAGYRNHVLLSEEEARLALRLWFQSRLVGLWAWHAYFFEGNLRVKDFFPTMIIELYLVSDKRWTESVVERFVRACCA